MDVQSFWEGKNKVSPLSRNLGQLVPPTLAAPAEPRIFTTFFILDMESIEIEYV
jgi:hypothetical protein